MTTLNEWHAKQMKNPEYAAEYERLQPEYDISDALITARAEENLTQRELAERCGMEYVTEPGTIAFFGLYAMEDVR